MIYVHVRNSGDLIYQHNTSIITAWLSNWFTSLHVNVLFIEINFIIFEAIEGNLGDVLRSNQPKSGPLL